MLMKDVMRDPDAGRVREGCLGEGTVIPRDFCSRRRSKEI